MANIRVDLNHAPLDGEAVTFKAPCDASNITGLVIYYDGESKLFTLTDANGGDIGVLDNIFAEGAIVKAILDTDGNKAFVQNPNTNTYLEDRFTDLESKDVHISDTEPTDATIWIDTSTEDGNRYYNVEETDARFATKSTVNALTAADVGAAPAGYGLGTGFGYPPEYDANNITGSGVYAANKNTPTTDMTWTVYAIAGTVSDQIQYAYDRNGATGAQTARLLQKRVSSSGNWQPWEYVNPPMTLGVEYRTTERWKGKPVYVKAVSTGALPVGGFANRISVDTKIDASTVAEVVRWGGSAIVGSTIATLPAHYSNDSRIRVSGYLYKYSAITCIIQAADDADYSAGTGTIWIAYTKTTD